MKMTPEHVADGLIEMGYFKFLPQSDRDVARRELVASLGHGYIGTEWGEHCISRDRRLYPADSEELAEGRTGEFILLMRDVLSHEGVRLQSVEDDYREERYGVVINGREYPIYDPNILAKWGSWTIAAKRLLEVVNELLRAAGSGEQLYGIHGGNEGRTIFLTAPMYDFLKSSLVFTDRREMPYPPSAINGDGTIRW